MEARIWDLLNAKLERIQHVLSSVMEEQEDIAQLVIGMSGSAMFNDLFAGAPPISAERLDVWFDRSTATLGGKDVGETGREMLGNVARFDFQQVGRDLPKVDLPDLEPFFVNATGRHGRRIFRRTEGLEVKTPDAWAAKDYAIKDKYEGLTFDRSLKGPSATARVLGVGHRLFDLALADAVAAPVTAAVVAGLDAPLLIVSVEDEVTGTGASVQRITLGISAQTGGASILRDWELLQKLNSLPLRTSVATEAAAGKDNTEIEPLMAALSARLAALVPSMYRPTAWPEVLLVPGNP